MVASVHSGARIGAAIVGGLLGFVLGAFLGSELGAMMSFAAHGYSGPTWPAEVGRVVGMAAGLVGGAALGAFLIGRPVVTAWCLGTAFAVGGIAFLAGFAGPILLSPDSPQGPLLGIFFTGPLGFVIGAMIGLGIGVAKERHHAARPV